MDLGETVGKILIFCNVPQHREVLGEKHVDDSCTQVVEELDASEVFGFVVVLGVRSPGLVGPKRRNTRASFGSSKEAMEQQAEEDAALGWALAC